MRQSPAGPSLGALALATVVATLTLAAPAQAAITTFRNSAPITLNDNAAASPYPSAVTASRLCGTVTRAAVVLTGLTHADTRDLDFMLVAPNGTKVLFLSDAGGAASDIALIIDDSVGAAPAPSGSITTGTYRSTNYGTTTDAFPAGPPVAGPVAGTLAAANGGPPNGSWQLFARDDSTGDVGSLSVGWALRLATPDCPPLVPGGGPFDDGEGGLDPEDGGLPSPITDPGAGLPTMSKLRLSPARFKASKKGGSKVAFTLSRAGSVKFTVERRTEGRQSGRKCVARKKSNRRKKRCTRWVKLKGSIAVTGKAGPNSFVFRGKLAGRYLKAGSYRFAAQAGTGGAVVNRTFTVLRSG